MSLYICLKHGCCPRTACSATFPGACVCPSPRRGLARRASLWPAARGCRAEAGCPFDVARGDETPSLADHSQGAWVEADAWAGLPDCPPCLPWAQARPSQAPAPLLGGRSAPSARSGRSLPSAPQRLRTPSARVCAAPPRGVVDLSAKRLDRRFPGFHPRLRPWGAETPFIQR